ncbi:MAG TPA: hypothetical protein VFE31_08850 [Opitutaceae bacterium]|jgi:hypothetical protein|nr:hypothetical protein [Opitutaceae bacterium]
MTIAEMIVALRIRAEGIDKLQKTDAALRKTAESAKAAAGAIQQANKAAADSRQMEFGFATPNGQQITFGFDKDNLQGLPPVLEKVTDKTTKSSFATRLMATDLKTVESWANKTAVAMDALAASMVYFADKGAQAFGRLENFTLGTGIRPARLLAAQGAGVGVGIRPEEMAQFVSSLQTAGVKMRLTGEGAGPWALLQALMGVPLDPRGDPLKLIDHLHRGLMQLRPDQVPMARVFAGQAGVPGSIFDALRNPAYGMEDFKQMYEILDRNAGKMNELNKEWGQLKFHAEVAGMALLTEFEPAIDLVLKALDKGIHLLARFVAWLDRDSAGAQITKIALSALAVALVLVAGGVTLLAGALAILTPVVTVLGVAFLPLLATVGLITAGLALMISQLERLHILKPLVQAADERDKQLEKEGHFRSAGVSRLFAGTVESMIAGPLGGLFGIDGPGDLRRGIWDLFTSMFHGAGSSSATMHNTFHINEAGNPHRSARAVADANRAMLSNAGYSIPAMNR